MKSYAFTPTGRCLRPCVVSPGSWQGAPHGEGPAIRQRASAPYTPGQSVHTCSQNPLRSKKFHVYVKLSIWQGFQKGLWQKKKKVGYCIRPHMAIWKCKLYLPRSAFSLRTSLKLSPLLRVDCLYFSKASFCPFLPKAAVFTEPAWSPHLHLEKSECTHLTRSSSFTITFSETAMTSSYKRWSGKNKTWLVAGKQMISCQQSPSEIPFEWINFMQAANVLLGDRESSITHFKGFSRLAV